MVSGIREMKRLPVGIQTAGWFDEKDPAKSFRFARECGFESVDYNIDTIIRIGRDEAGNSYSFMDKTDEDLLQYYEPFKAAAEVNNIKISQIHAHYPTYVVGDEERNAYHIKVMERILFVSRFLECPAVVIHPTKTPDRGQEREINLTMCRNMIPAALKYNVMICIENSLKRINKNVVQAIWTDVEEINWYIDTLNAEAGKEVFGFCLDTGHSHIVGRDVEMLIEDLGSRLKVLHIHDNNGTEDEHLIPYTQNPGNKGMGQIGWDGVIKALRKMNYEGALSFECARGVKLLPEGARREGMELISAIGRYFRKAIIEG